MCSRARLAGVEPATSAELHVLLNSIILIVFSPSKQIAIPQNRGNPKSLFNQKELLVNVSSAERLLRGDRTNEQLNKHNVLRLRFSTAA
jgi:hypothetical protein